MLKDSSAVHRAGNELTFVYEAAADSVELGGGLQYPMARITGTDMFVITLVVPGADRATVSYFFMPYKNNDLVSLRFIPSEWRGPAATRPVAGSKTLHGTITYDTITHSLLRRPRAVSVYAPPARDDQPIAGVVYLGDGAGPGLAATVDTLIIQGVLPRVMLVSIDADRRLPGEPAGTVDYRSLEYLLIPGEDSSSFLAHEKFLFDVVMSWAESRFGAPAERHSRALAGFSNSAAFALEIALRNPRRVGHAIALSPAGRLPSLSSDTRLNLPARFYVSGGTLEKPFHQKALAWSRVFRTAGVPHLLSEPVAGHDWSAWRSEFIAALRWAFGGSGMPGNS